MLCWDSVDTLNCIFGDGYKILDLFFSGASFFVTFLFSLLIWSIERKRDGNGLNSSLPSPDGIVTFSNDSQRVVNVRVSRQLLWDNAYLASEKDGDALKTHGQVSEAIYQDRLFKFLENKKLLSTHHDVIAPRQKLEPRESLRFHLFDFEAKRVNIAYILVELKLSWFFGIFGKTRFQLYRFVGGSCPALEVGGNMFGLHPTGWHRIYSYDLSRVRLFLQRLLRRSKTRSSQ